MISKLRLTLYTALGVLAIVGLMRLVSLVRHSGANVGSRKAPLVLPAMDKEQVLVNTLKHEITIVTPTKTTTEYARKATIDVEKNGTVNVQRQMFGLEFSPFLGVGYSDMLRVHLGASGLFFQRLDLNVQLAVAVTRTPGAVQPYVSLSYNVFGNTLIFVGVNPLRFLPAQTPQIAGGIAVRF